MSGTRQDTDRVAVVVPLSSRPEILPEEEISLRHLRHYLGRYDKYMVAAESLAVDHEGFRVKRFPDRFFGSVQAYSAMMLSPEFYEAFADYEYILTYHLDALVFADELLEWCDAGYDLIGAPNHGPNDHLSVVGNGGFALRKVQSFLGVLRSRRYAVDPEAYWENFCRENSRLRQWINLPRKYLKRLHRFNNVQRDIQLSLQAPGLCLEDVFYLHKGPHYFPGFRVPDVRTALRFSFDESPRKAWEMNGRRLPFGCHAWYKQDRAFWEPYLLPESAAVTQATA